MEAKMSRDELDYRDAVMYLAEQKDDMLFSNKGAVHAAIVMTAFFTFAEEEVLIFSEKLNKSVANDSEFMKALSKYIVSGKSLKVLLEKDIPDDPSPALIKVMEAAKENPTTVELKTLRSEDIPKIREFFTDNKVHHFAVADQRAFRVEIDPDEFKAIVSFNQPEKAAELHKLFDYLFR